MQEQEDLKISLSFQLRNGFKEYTVTNKSKIDFIASHNYMDGGEIYEVVIVLGTIIEIAPKRFTVKTGWGDKQNLLRLKNATNIEVQFLSLDDAVSALVNQAIREGVLGHSNIKIVPITGNIEDTKDFLEQVEKSRKSRHPFIIEKEVAD